MFIIENTEKYCKGEKKFTYNFIYQEMTILTSWVVSFRLWFLVKAYVFIYTYFIKSIGYSVAAIHPLQLISLTIFRNGSQLVKPGSICISPDT